MTEVTGLLKTYHWLLWKVTSYTIAAGRIPCTVWSGLQKIVFSQAKQLAGESFRKRK